MRIRLIAASAAIGLCGTLFTAPAGAVASGGLNLVLDTWAPSVGDCQQRVTFRLLPSATGDGASPTGAVRLVSDSGAALGSVPVQGFGSYEVRGACATDGDAHPVELAYTGDNQYAARSVFSPDWCPRDPETLSPEAWQGLVGVGDPEPVFMCYTNTNQSIRASIRSKDGRLYAGHGWFAMYPNPWKYGEEGSISFHLDGDPDRQPTAPTGTAVASVDGTRQRTFTIDGRRGSYNWNVDTAGALPGRHSLLIVYRGDQRWAPVLIAGQTFRIVKGRPTGAYSVKRWQLKRGQRPVVTIRFRNVWSRKAKAPTGKVSFYLGAKHVYDTRLRTRDQGHRTVTLPPTRRIGSQLLRVVYRGDARYTSLDSKSPHWSSNQQYLQVR